MPTVDVHVHLPAYGDPKAQLEEALATGSTLVSCTVKPSEAPANLKIREENPETVLSFLGVHPSEVSDRLPSQEMAAFLEGADGIGEIGLDPKYSPVSPGSNQMVSFLDQLALAERLGKPVEVHSRGSAELCLDTMGSFRLKSVLMHWFEDEGMLPRVRSTGYYISVGPAILYSKKVRRIAASVGRDRLLTESDGPVSFGPLGGAGGSGLIPSVVFALSGLDSSSYADKEAELWANARRFLGKSGAHAP